MGCRGTVSIALRRASLRLCPRGGSCYDPGMNSARNEWLVTAALLVIAVSIYFAPALFGGKVVWTANTVNWYPWKTTATRADFESPSFTPDFSISYYPRRVVLAEAWRTKTWPLWNPYSFCGAPFLADIQTAVFYPINWLLVGLEPIRQFPPFLSVHFIIGGLGLFFLLRVLGVAGIPAAGAALAFACNEYFFKKIGLPTFLATAAWAPWAIACAYRVARAPTADRIAAAALVWAITFLAGQPQTVIQIAYVTMILLAVDFLVRRFGRSPADDGSSPTDHSGTRAGHGITPAAHSITPRGLGALFLAGGLTVLLVSVQLLPTAELAGRSARASLSYATMLSGSFHPVEWIRIAIPDFLGTPVTGDGWSNLFSRGNNHFLRIAFSAISAGTPIAILALWSLFVPGIRKRVLPFAVLFVLVALVAFGTPLLKLAYEYLPGFRFSRVDRAGYFLILCQFVMAAFAARSLRDDKAGVMRKVFGGAIVLAFAATYFWVRGHAPYMPYELGSLRALPPPATLAPEQAAAIVTRTQSAALFAWGTALAFFLPAGRIAAALPFILAAAQLFQIGLPYRGLRDVDEILRDDPAIAELRTRLDEGDAGGGRFARFGRDAGGFYTFSSVIPPSTNVPFALRDVQGYNALSPRGLGDALERATGENLFSHGLWAGRRIVEPEQTRSLEHPLFDALSTRVIVSHLAPGQPEAPRAKGWTFVSRNGFYTWENREFLPRARLVPRGEGVNADELARRVDAGAFDPAHEAIWAGEGLVNGSTTVRIIGGAGRARVTEDEWNQVTIEVAADHDCVLVLADSYDPGWKATIDGEPAPVLAAYGLVRAVIMPAGAHTVLFTYGPNAFRLGGALSLAGLAILGTLFVRAFRAFRARGAR